MEWVVEYFGAVPNLWRDETSGSDRDVSLLLLRGRSRPSAPAPPRSSVVPASYRSLPSYPLYFATKASHRLHRAAPTPSRFARLWESERSPEHRFAPIGD